MTDPLDALHALAERWRASRAHTYSSENADLYRGFDNGCQRCAEDLDRLIADLRVRLTPPQAEERKEDTRVDGVPSDRPLGPTASRHAPQSPREVQLGVIEFHSERVNPGLIKRFYAVRDDLTAAGCIVDLWLLDIQSVLQEFGYQMRVFTHKPFPTPAREDRDA